MPGLLITQVASSVPFDNATNGFAATNVQAAIEEVNSFFSTPTIDQQYWVTKEGNDTTGNGSIGAPYLTIGKALSVITDSSPTKRYSINVGPGDYPESLSWKANVFTKGSGPIATRITGSTQNINDTTWNVAAADNRSGWQDLSLNGVATWDFTAQAGNSDGKLYLYNVRTSGAWTLKAQNSVNQIIVRDTDFFGAWTQDGINSFISNSTFQSGAITLNSSTVGGGINTTMTIISGRITANITATWTSNAPVTLNLAGLNCGPSTILTASGASCTVNANDGSLPIPANRSFTSSAVLNRVNDDYARGLLHATGQIDVSAATAPLAGQVLTASSSTLGIWSYPAGVSQNLGDGSDGALSMSSGTLNLTRDMYYTTITLSGTAIVNSNGWKIYCQGACALSGTSTIQNNGASGTNASGGTIGTGGAVTPGNSVGVGQAGANGGAFGNNTNGSPGGSTAAVLGYGGASATAGLGGDSGSHLATGGAAGTAGTYTSLPERVIRHDHIINMAYKIAGQGGPGGGGGASSVLTTAGAGGGGGAGGGVVFIFCGSFNNTSSVGIQAKGGNGGNGGTATGGNSGSGGGGSGGGGGQIFIYTIVMTALGTLTVTGGTAGTTGAKAGGGFVGTNGSAGSTGKTTAFTSSTNTWTVT